MAMPVVNGAMCSCTFGVAPCPLMATSQQQGIGGQYAGGDHFRCDACHLWDVFIHGKSNGRQCNGGRTGRSDANARVRLSRPAYGRPVLRPYWWAVSRRLTTPPS